MARKTDRNFLADFATLDIEYLPVKGPKVSDDIQMVYVMGDVSTPAAVPSTGFFRALRVGGERINAVAAAVRATVELQAVVDCWVFYGHQVVTGTVVFSTSAVALLAGHAAPRWNSGGVQSLIAFGGGIVDANGFLIPVEGRNLIETAGGVHVPAGTFFRMQGGANGVNTEYILWWRELR